MKLLARFRSAAKRPVELARYLYRLPPYHPHRFYTAQIILYVGVGLILLATVLRAHSAELPPHAVAVDQYGTWTCERGYLMRARGGGFECVPEEEAAREPQFEVSRVPSAGEGASSGGSEDLGQRYGYSEAPMASEVPVVIQSNQPWTMILDEQGNPSTVIVGGSESHHHHRGPSRGKDGSHGNHRLRQHQPPGTGPSRPGAPLK
jgi:hypothetical protein